MEIYVDKLPKSCKSCDFRCYGECKAGVDILNLDYSTMQCHLKKSKPQDCPLKTISEVKREVIKDTYNYLNEKGYLNIESYAINKVLKILLGEEADE